MSKVDDIKKRTERFVAQGWNKKQATSLAWCEYFSDWMDLQWANSPMFAYEIRIDCWCEDCQKGGQFIPSIARGFILDHKDHNTKTVKLR